VPVRYSDLLAFSFWIEVVIFNLLDYGELNVVRNRVDVTVAGR